MRILLASSSHPGTWQITLREVDTKKEGANFCQHLPRECFRSFVGVGHPPKRSPILKVSLYGSLNVVLPVFPA